MEINKRRERMNMTIKDIYEEITQTKIKTNMLELCMVGDNIEDDSDCDSDNDSESNDSLDDDESIDIPSCKIYF